MEQKIDMKNMIEDSFVQYAGAVLQSRALVDVRDCIKPSARQIFYCLYTDKFLSSKPFKKTLKAIGSVARMYIHGDSSAEGVIMRAGQPFAMRYPLIEIEGNGGNLIESGNWAAPRYSSARLSQLSELLFEAVDKETIDEWRDNYDDTEKYPTVLPSKGFYNIVNGSFGIGVGASSSITQHNIKDVNKALVTLLQNPDATFEELYCPVDFATGGYLINEAEVKESLKNGQGAACKLRAKIDYNEKDRALVVTEMPYGVYTNTVCKELEGIIESEENPGIERFNDLTHETPLLKIYLMKKTNPQAVLKYLYKHTSLQNYYSINFTMLKDGRFPKVFTWKDALQEHINHEIQVYNREFRYNLKKIEYKIMINEGLLKCLADIDTVVKLIKESESTTIAKTKLIKSFVLNEEQAAAVLKITLSRLAHLEIEKLRKETEDLKTEANQIREILSNKELFNSYLIKGWEETACKYGDEHRTKMIQIVEDDSEEENIKPEDVVVILMKNGKIKRIPKESFKTQKRNTKGIKTIDESILTTISTNTIDTLMFFTSDGKLYRALVDNIPAGAAKDKGIDLSMILNIKRDEKIVAATSLNKNQKAQYVCFVTKQGLIKKTPLKEYFNGRKNAGIAAIKMHEGDSIAAVTFVDDEEMVMTTRKGQAIRLQVKDISPVGKIAMGVKGITLKPQDEVINAFSFKSYIPQIAVFTIDGYGKKFNISELPIQGRGGKGVSISKVEIANAMLVEEDSKVFISGRPNSICIEAKEIPSTGRMNRGNIMIKQSNIIDVVKL